LLLIGWRSLAIAASEEIEREIYRQEGDLSSFAAAS